MKKIIIISLLLLQAFSASAKQEQRIVSLAGNITEILFLIGLGDQIVGRDVTSIYPPEAAKIREVGSGHRVAAEGVLSLKPTLFLANQRIKPEHAPKQISQAGVTVELLPQLNTCSEAAGRIQKIGTLTNKQSQSEELVRKLRKDLQEVKSKVNSFQGKRKKALALYIRGKKVQYILGAGTGVPEMIKLAGASNAAENIKNFKPITAEAIISLNPDVYVLMKHGVDSIGGIDQVAKLPGISFTEAGKNKKFVVMDDYDLGGMGPGCAQAAMELHKRIYEI